MVTSVPTLKMFAAPLAATRTVVSNNAATANNSVTAAVPRTVRLEPRRESGEGNGEGEGDDELQHAARLG